MATRELIQQQIEQLATNDYGRLLSLLIKYGNDICLAEDALQFAFAQASEHWSKNAIPSVPGAWLYRVGVNFMLNRFKSNETNHISFEFMDCEVAEPSIEKAFEDYRLGLLFACAHPAIDKNVHTPLMLQLVLGINVEKIARAFAIPTTRLAQKLVRAKKKLSVSKFPFEIPEPDTFPSRVNAVLAAIYGCYAIDWLRFNAVETKEDMAEEALFLATLLVKLMPEHAESFGLAALLSISHARSKSRFAIDGSFVPFEEQHTNHWNKLLLRQGEHLIQQAFLLKQPGRYQLEAAIQSAHCHRLITGQENWEQIQNLYIGLIAIAPSLGAHVSLSLVILKSRGASVALNYLDNVEHPHKFHFQPALLAYAQIYASLDSCKQASAFYQQALDLTTDVIQRAHIAKKLRESQR